MIKVSILARENGLFKRPARKYAGSILREKFCLTLSAYSASEHISGVQMCFHLCFFPHAILHASLDGH